MNRKHRLITLLACMAVMIAVVLIMAPAALAANHIPFLTVSTANSPYTISQSTSVDVLTIKPGGWIVAPAGKAVTLTVNGVETGGILESTAGTATLLSQPGIYKHALLTVTDENLFDYTPAGPPGTPHVFFPFRQALYVDASGVVDSKSVLAALLGLKPVTPLIKDVSVTSTGQNFDGFFMAGGSWTIKNAKIRLTGNGRSDFCGYGAAIVANGPTSKLVVDGANVVNKGVMRAAVVAESGASVVVKNSYLETFNGILPSDYTPTIDTAQMRSVPWMLSLSGNVRATNLLGVNTKASYINSTIKSQGWGVLSTDGCTTPTLTAINSTIAIIGKDGYGSYGIGDATENFLGDTFNVATYATISRGSFLHYGDSSPAAVSALNTSLGLGLTPAERAAIPNKPTVVNSKRFGIMWHGGGTLDITGGTVFNTKEATFLDKGQAIAITVDGSKGARLHPANGILMQVMDDDDPGPVPPAMTNTGIYNEPSGPVTPQVGHDLTVAGANDAVATFSNISLKGDFYNGMRGDIAGMFGPPSPRNLGLTFDNARITGVISSTTAHHILPHIEYPVGLNGIVNVGHTNDYEMLGEVTNTASAAVNNGVIVTLNGHSVWTVTGTCYLTKLVVGAGAAVAAPAGHHVVMTVGGVPKAIVPGSSAYTGAIVLTLAP